MRWKKSLVIVSFLFFAFVLAVIAMYELGSEFDNDQLYSIIVEGVTFFSILFCLMLTIHFNSERILIVGWCFLLIGAFMDVIDEAKNLAIPHMIELVFENGMYAVGMILISVGFLVIINKRDEMHEKMEFMALHDSLTGLPNRKQLYQYLSEALYAAKNQQEQLAVMFIDLDGFKQVNDKWGHFYGDSLLKEAAKKLKNCVHEGDMVARFAGDEFILIIKNANHNQASLIAQSIIDAIASIDINQHNTLVTPSIGISLYPNDGDYEDLINKADKAMYAAKNSGKNNYKFYRENL